MHISPIEKSRAEPAFSVSSACDFCLGRAEGAVQQERRGQHGCARRGGGAEPWFAPPATVGRFGQQRGETIGKMESAVKRKHRLITAPLAGCRSTQAFIDGAGV